MAAASPAVGEGAACSRRRTWKPATPLGGMLEAEPSAESTRQVAAAAGRRAEGPEGAWTWLRVRVSRQKVQGTRRGRRRSHPRWFGGEELKGGAVFDVLRLRLRRLHIEVVNNDAELRVLKSQN